MDKNIWKILLSKKLQLTQLRVFQNMVTTFSKIQQVKGVCYATVSIPLKDKDEFELCPLHEMTR